MLISASQILFHSDNIVKHAILIMQVKVKHSVQKLDISSPSLPYISFVEKNYPHI